MSSRSTVSPSIIVIGSANTDLVVQVPRLPRPGETVLAGTFTSHGGGKGANQAVAAARAGGATTFIARLGCDAFGDTALAAWQTDGIDTRLVCRDAATPSGVALILVDAQAENCIAVAPGANERLAEADVEAGRTAIAAASAVLIQLEIPFATVRRGAECARAAGVRTILNPAPARPLEMDLLRLVDLITPNETEAEVLTGIRVDGEASAALAADRLLSQGPSAVVITLGAKGAFVADLGGKRLVPGFPVTPVDTVAAGDVFNGALAVALGEGRDLDAAVRFANAAAAISVTRRGAQSSAPRRQEIDRLVAGC